MKYIKEDIEKMLKEYPINESKLTEVEIKIEEYQEELYYAGTVYEDTEKEVIEFLKRENIEEEKKEEILKKLKKENSLSYV